MKTPLSLPIQSEDSLLSIKKPPEKDLVFKTCSFNDFEFKQEDRNGVPVGIIEGYIATWDLDRGNGFFKDQFVKGAFRKSIRDLKRRGRPLRFNFGHSILIGGFPPESLKEDDTGLFGVGEVNLEVQTGAESYSLARQGILSDFSIGFQIIKSTRDEQKDIRTITEAIAWEGSIVDEPMNPNAMVTQVKNLEENMDPITEDEVKTFTKRDLEDALREGKSFTKKGAIMVSSLFNGVEPPETEEQKALRIAEEDKATAEKQVWGNVLDEVNSLTKSLK